MVVALVLAQEGGWDEALLVAAPLAAFAGLLMLAKRRAASRSRPTANETHDDI